MIFSKGASSWDRNRTREEIEGWAQVQTRLLWGCDVRNRGESSTRNGSEPEENRSTQSRVKRTWEDARESFKSWMWEVEETARWDELFLRQFSPREISADFGVKWAQREERSVSFIKQSKIELNIIKWNC